MRSPLSLQNAPRPPTTEEEYDKGEFVYQSDLARWTADTSDFLRATPFDEYNFVYVPGTAGSPTQTPVGLPNSVPLDVDTTNSLLYYYFAGAWHSIGGGGGGGGTVTSITATTPIVVTPSPITSTGVISHATSGVSAATYGDGTHVGQFAVDAKGHITSATNVAITGVSTAWVTLTWAGTTNTDASLGSNFRLTLSGTGSTLLANPTNMTDGQQINWLIQQDGSGSRLVTFGTKFKFFGQFHTVSTTASAIDMVSGIYHAGDDVIYSNMILAAV